jgi:hypothetical protein
MPTWGVGDSEVIWRRVQVSEIVLLGSQPKSNL